MNMDIGFLRQIILAGCAAALILAANSARAEPIKLPVPIFLMKLT